jgi:Branched-chain amino acid transport system / permease component
MNAWLQILLDFVWVSACLALVSFSLGLILGELKIVNIAQGNLMMVGAYSMYAMRALPFVLALLLTVAFGLVLGLVLERGILRWVYDKGFTAWRPSSRAGASERCSNRASPRSSPCRRGGVDSPLKGKLSIGDFS